MSCFVTIEHQLDDHHPVEQQRFRPGKPIEEHLLTASAFLGKTLAVGTPVWVVSVDLSKPLASTLWESLREQGISQHMISMISHSYDGQ